MNCQFEKPVIKNCEHQVFPLPVSKTKRLGFLTKEDVPLKSSTTGRQQCDSQNTNHHMTTVKWQGSCKKNASQANGRRPHKLIYYEEEEKILQIWA